MMGRVRADPSGSLGENNERLDSERDYPYCITLVIDMLRRVVPPSGHPMLLNDAQSGALPFCYF